MNRQQNYGSISTPAVEVSGTNLPEFNDLCDSVVTNIYTINSSIKTLENAVKNIGTSKDNHGLRNNVQVTQLSTNQIASATTRILAKLKSFVVKGTKQNQLQVEKLEENFKEVINKYYVLQKEVINKQKAHLLVSVSIENEPTTPDDDTHNQKQAQMSRHLEFEQEMMLEREARVREIEANVLDINQIMRELGSIVNEQSELIDSIENNIDHGVSNVEEGREQLLKASRSMNKYRKKLIFLVIIALIIAIILISVLAVKL